MRHPTKFIIGMIAIWGFSMNVVAEDIYFLATAKEDGNTIIIRSLKRVPDGVKEDLLPNRMTVIWRYESSRANGMPEAGENEAQVAFEDTLASLDINAVSRLMVVMTGNYEKSWNWYVGDVKDWMIKFNKLLSSHRSYPIEIIRTYEPDWVLYKTILASTK